MHSRADHLFNSKTLRIGLRAVSSTRLRVLDALLMSTWVQKVEVVAHPDDEAMFFWPTLAQLHDAGVRLSVLCLSTGNFDGLGDLRRQEMVESCKQIGGQANLFLRKKSMPRSRGRVFASLGRP